jgi:hypothetical protein
LGSTISRFLPEIECRNLTKDGNKKFDFGGGRAHHFTSAKRIFQSNHFQRNRDFGEHGEIPPEKNIQEIACKKPHRGYQQFQ